MLLRQIDAIDNVSSQLKKVNSLLTLLADYFKPIEPKAAELQARYKTYQDVVSVVTDIVFVQKQCIDEANGKLDTIRKELQRLGELI